MDKTFIHLDTIPYALTKTESEKMMTCFQLLAVIKGRLIGFNIIVYDTQCMVFSATRRKFRFAYMQCPSGPNFGVKFDYESVLFLPI